MGGVAKGTGDDTEGLPPDAPPAPLRRRLSLVIAAALVLQVLVPLRYYLGDDPYDERFSWRMFSAVRVIRCQTLARERGAEGPPRPLRLNRVIHRAWITNLQRNREDVIRAFLRRRCEEEGIQQVELLNRCIGADGARLDPIYWSRDCEAEETTGPTAPPTGEVSR